MKYSEYLSLVEKDPTIGETSAERLYRIIHSECESSSKFPFKQYLILRQGEHKIYGLSEVIDSFAEGLRTAVVAYKKGQVPLFVITGPSGCGKTEFGKKLEEVLVNDMQVNRRYTFSIKTGDKEHHCPINEDPINLLTSKLSLTPSKVREQFYEPGKPLLCPSCIGEYNSILKSKLADVKYTNLDDYARLLDEFIEVNLLPPPIATADLTKENFNSNISEIINNCNRGILHLEVNDCEFTDMLPENYQTLLKLGDGRLIQNDGTSLTPDLVVILYTNWNKDQMERKKPFADRSFNVRMRWNLSWKEEMQLYSDFGLPYNHVNGAALEGAAKSLVGSRYQNDISAKVGATQRDKEKLQEWLSKYIMFEDNNPAMKDEDINEVLNRLNDSKNKDGRQDGFSVRQGLREVSNIKPGLGDCLGPSDILNWLDKNRGKLGTTTTAVATEYIADTCISDVVLAHTYNKISGGVDAVDKVFHKYYEIFTGAYIPNHDYVVYNNKELKPVEALEAIEEKLGVSSKKRKEFMENIQMFMDQTVPKRLPSFEEIIEMDNTIIIPTIKDIDYLPWEKILKREPMTAVEKERIDKITKWMIERMGYCRFCAEDALSISAKENL